MQISQLIKKESSTNRIPQSLLPKVSKLQVLGENQR